MRRRDLSSLARSASQTLLDRIESNRRRPARVRPRDARETTTNRRMKMRARTASPHRRLARAFRRLARANSTDPRLASRSDESARARSIDRSRAVSSTRSGATKTVARVRRRGASRVRARARVRTIAGMVTTSFDPSSSRDEDEHTRTNQDPRSCGGGDSSVGRDSSKSNLRAADDPASLATCGMNESSTARASHRARRRRALDRSTWRTRTSRTVRPTARASSCRRWE